PRRALGSAEHSTKPESRTPNPHSELPASQTGSASRHRALPSPWERGRERVGGSTHLPDRPSRMRPAALSGLRAITNHESPITNHESRIPNPESPIPAPSRVARVSGAHPGSPLGEGGRERVGGPRHLPDSPSRMRPAPLSGLRATQTHESRVTNPA